MRKLIYICTAALGALFPALASAHEVYVLSPEQIQTGLTAAPFSELQVATSNMHQFMFWALVVVIVVTTIFFTSFWHIVEENLGGLFKKLPPYAPTISRITVGVSLLGASYFGSLFGPELPIEGTFGLLTNAVRVLLVIIGVCFIFNFYAELAALALLVLFFTEVLKHGAYMLTYTNYLGEALALAFLFRKKWAPYGFLVARVCFGTALIYASYYAKILHNDLALQVASLPLAGHPYPIAHYLGFEPHFLVLGAALIEILIGLFFIFGIEIRWTSIFLLFWLSLSLVYFGEVVWPHLILIGIPLSFICYGYDRFSLEGYFLKKHGHEPIL